MLSVAALSFVCAFIKASLGMGYGTTLTPLLLILGYSPSVVIPSVLLSGFTTGIISGAFHHSFGSISLRGGSRDRGIVMLLLATGAIGAAAAALTTTIMSSRGLEIYIGTMVLTMGGLVFVFRKHRLRFSWPRMTLAGIVASFNKGISGGGYGPVIVSGQLLSGHGVRNAVGIGCLGEGLVCAVGFSLHLLLNGGPAWITTNRAVVVPAVLGAMVAAPLGSRATLAIEKNLDLKAIIALLTVGLGLVTLWGAIVG